MIRKPSNNKYPQFKRDALKNGLFLLAFVMITSQSLAQIQNKRVTHLSQSYDAISPLGKYLYDSLFYEEARTQQVYEYGTFSYFSDSISVEGYSCLPTSIKGKHPVIIYNRGGTGNYGKLNDEIFPYFYELAKQGFLIYASNYRFVGKNGKYDELGGADVNDVLNLVQLVKHLPYVDSANVFMMGVSRGGLMTYSAARQIAFNAIAIVSGVSSTKKQSEYRPIFLNGWTDLSEDENYLGLSNVLPDYEAKKQQYLLDRNPVEWAGEIKSPALILHSRQDGFVRVDQAFDMALALEYAGKSYQLKVYNQKSHSLPSNNFDSIEEIMNWFKQHTR